MFIFFLEYFVLRVDTVFISVPKYLFSVVVEKNIYNFELHIVYRCTYAAEIYDDE